MSRRMNHSDTGEYPELDFENADASLEPKFPGLARQAKGVLASVSREEARRRYSWMQEYNFISILGRKFYNGKYKNTGK